VRTTLELPYPPSVWKLYSGYGKRRHRSNEYKKWLDQAGWLLKTQKPRQHAGKVSVTIFATKPDKRARDLENLLKPCNDLLVTHQVIKDDSLIGVLHCAWRDDGEGVTVIVEDISGA